MRVKIDGEVEHRESDFLAGELHKAQEDHKSAADKIRLGVVLLENLSDGADTQGGGDENGSNTQAEQERKTQNVGSAAEDISEVARQKERDAARRKERHHAAGKCGD